MNYTDSLQAFLARYFPTFIGAFFLALFSLSCTISLLGSTFFRGAPQEARYTLVAALSLTVILCFANFMMIRGRTWGVWIIVALLVVCLLCVLPTYSYRPHMFSYIAGILFPLLGLLMLNSKRHRKMRDELVRIREERIKTRHSHSKSR